MYTIQYDVCDSIFIMLMTFTAHTTVRLYDYINIGFYSNVGVCRRQQLIATLFITLTQVFISICIESNCS